MHLLDHLFPESIWDNDSAAFKKHSILIGSVHHDTLHKAWLVEGHGICG